MAEKKFDREEYKKTHYKRLELTINRKEKDVLKKLESVSSKTQYIVDLIKKDIKK